MSEIKPILQVDCEMQLGNFLLQPKCSLQSDFTALFGPSGCGKTSTLKLIAGLLQPHRGQVRLADRVLYDSESRLNTPPETREVGLVFQDGRLFPHLSVQKNLQFGLQNTPPAKQRLRFDDVVDVLRISHLLERRPATLSGGEIQRIAIGRALLASPKLLLMDEPLAAVDIPSKLSLLVELHKIRDVFHIPIVYVSHDLSTVLNIASHVMRMDAGRIVAEGQPFEVLANYVHKPLMETDEIRNLLEMTVTSHNAERGSSDVTSGGVSFVLPHISAAVGARLTIDIPASEILLAIEKPVGLSARNIIAGKVVQIHHFGSRVIVKVDIGMVLSVEIVEGTLAGLEIAVGKRVFLVMKATAFRKVGER